MKELVLVVEDNPDILELLEHSLISAGYETLGFLNTKNVRQALSEEKIDLIIMDRMLPDIEGSMFIEILRRKNIQIPVIFLSGKDSIEDIKDGFLKGADDYITKPFDIGELLLRVKAVLKRYNRESKEMMQVIQYRDITMDFNLHRVTIETLEVNLTKLEVALLQVMILNKGKVLDRNFLLKHIWKDTQNIHQKTVNVAMKRLKEKIDPTREKEYIKTIRGVGYVLA